MAVVVSMVIEHDFPIEVPISPIRKWFSASVSSVYYQRKHEICIVYANFCVPPPL